MERQMAARAGCGVLVGAALLVGCGSAAERRNDQMLGELGRMRPVPRDDGRQLFAGAAQLERAAVVEAALARNPDVDAAREAWRAALAEARGAGALEDPMLSYALAPLSVSGDAPFGQRVELSQKLPWPGKRRLAAEARVAEAEAARGDLEAVRLELALMASNLFDDLYVNARALEINRQHEELIRQFKKAAEAQYVAGRASQQDPLQAEVELAHLEHDRILLEAEREAIAAQLNGLLRRAPSAPLPPPPAELPVPDAAAADARSLADDALRARPELRAQEARLRGARAEVDAARREYFPDIELMGSYDSMWDMPEHRWMVGIGLNIPLQIGRRRAEVEKAQAMTARARSEDEKLRIRIEVDVQRAAVRAREGVHIVHVVEERLLPAARDQVKAARAGYVAGNNEFVTLIAAVKNLRQIELELHHARADLARRFAALDRAVGRVPGLSAGGAR
jgi:outer membrane protein, heavy metal efflux system